MGNTIFDHVAIGVADGEEVLRRLRRDLGVTPLSGEVLPAFRYVLTRMGDESEGMQLELIDPQGGEGSFMSRFLNSHGEGVHHLTFTVSNVEQTVAHLEAHDFRVVQKDYSHPPWREAFIYPSEPGVGVVVQIADTNKTYPSMPEFLREPIKDPEAIPHNRGGKDRYWWSDVRQNIDPGGHAYLRAVDLVTEHMDRSLLLFSTILGGQPTNQTPETVVLEWKTGTLSINAGNMTGVRSLRCLGLPQSEYAVGSAVFKELSIEDGISIS